MLNDNIPFPHSSDKWEFPPEADARDWPESPRIVGFGGKRTDVPEAIDVFLPAAKLGKCCDPQIGPGAVAFEAALHNWRSRSRTLPDGNSKLEYSLGDAIETLGPRLAGPLALAVIDQWQHVSYFRFPLPHAERQSVIDSQRELVEKRVAVLHVWRESLRHRPRGYGADQASIDFARTWNDEHPDFHVSRTGLYRWWGRYQRFGIAGLARIVGPMRGQFKKIIPAPFWRALWRQYMRWWIPRMQTVVNGALAECSAEIRSECERLIESGTVQRRMLTIPDAVRNLLPDKPTSSYSHTAAALARSRRVLRLLLWLSETESTGECAGTMTATGDQR